MESQTTIGAQGLLEGLLSRHWWLLQQRHFDRLRSSRSVDLWAAQLVQQLLRLGHYMWEDRNRDFHSESNSRYHGGQQAEVDKSIWEQFSMGSVDLPPCLQSLLAEPLQSVLRRSLEDREHWLRLVSWERALHRCSLARQRHMIYVLLHKVSLQSSQQYLQDIKMYLRDEYCNTQGGQPLPEGWKLCRDSVPQQHNGNDCGVFTSMFAEELLLEEDLEFQLQNVNQYRRKMTAFVQAVAKTKEF